MYQVLIKYVSTVSCNNTVRQTIPYVDNPVSKTIFTQIILKSNLLQSHIITSSSSIACWSLTAEHSPCCWGAQNGLLCSLTARAALVNGVFRQVAVFPRPLVPPSLPFLSSLNLKIFPSYPSRTSPQSLPFHISLGVQPPVDCSQGVLASQFSKFNMQFCAFTRQICSSPCQVNDNLRKQAKSLFFPAIIT